MKLLVTGGAATSEAMWCANWARQATTSRFAVQANLLAATVEDEAATNQVYNVAIGDRTSLNDLYRHLRDSLVERFPHLKDAQLIYRDFRAGDVRHSLAGIARRKACLVTAPPTESGMG